MPVLTRLRHFFTETVPVRPGEGILVAFSGGPDSTALLAALAELREPLGIDLRAAHLDHALDPGAATRAAAAARLAAQLHVALVVRRLEVETRRRPGESREAAARRLRYAFLTQERRGAGARWIATAHHLEDQAETVLLRILFGTGLEGLGGIEPVSGPVVRPLLDTPRAALLELLEARGLRPVEDPTNLDLGVPRNRIRHRLLPRLAREGLEPGALASLAAAARGARRLLRRRLCERLDLRVGSGGASLSLDAFGRLPPALRQPALALLHDLAGAGYPAGSGPRRELERQLAAGRGVGCDCGGGWRWRVGRGRLLLSRSGTSEPAFQYTLGDDRDGNDSAAPYGGADRREGRRARPAPRRRAAR